jgi:hypothetical protein
MTLVIAIVAGVLVGVVAALKIVAPLTKTTVDDKALELAEKAEAVVESIKK